MEVRIRVPVAWRRAEDPQARTLQKQTALDAFTDGFTLQKARFPLDPSAYVPAAQQFLPLIPVERFPYLNGMSQEVIAGRHDGLHQLDRAFNIGHQPGPCGVLMAAAKCDSVSREGQS